jgi:hypothetical protein
MIFWGTKEVLRGLGFAADFCPLCRDVRAFEIKRVGMAGHVYGLSLGEGELSGYIRTCTVCRSDLNATPDVYRKLSDKPLAMSELAALTYPNLKESYAKRLAVEATVKTSAAQVSQADRSALIREPFVLLSPKVEQRFASLNLDAATLLTAVIAPFVIAFAADHAALVLPAAAAKAVNAITIATFIAWIIGLVVLHSRAADNYMRKEIFPVIVPALLPLKPTPQELDAVLKEMKKLGRKIGAKLRLRALLAAMRAPPPGKGVRS